MPALSSNSRQALIRLARIALKQFVRTGEFPSTRPEEPELWEPQPCFVTLRKGGRLRGCVGTLHTEKPLFQGVIEMTQAAASEDPRFPRIQPEEVGQMEIEISVVSPLERIRSADEIEVGRHGVYLRGKDRSGAFLPEVAREMGWTAEEFVKACGREKAHLPEGAWAQVELYRFTTEKIREKDQPWEVK